MNTSQLQPAEKIVESLLNYQKELTERAILSGRYSEELLKINSCLYSKYPHHEKDSK